MLIFIFGPVANFAYQSLALVLYYLKKEIVLSSFSFELMFKPELPLIPTWIDALPS